MSLGVVQSVRAKYPTPLGAQHAAFLLEVAAALNLGLLKKSGGTFIVLPDGTKVSQDCVMERNGVHYDILFDGENKAEPRFDRVNIEGTDQPFLTDPNNYYAVAASPTPQPTPEPPTDLKPIIAELASLNRSIAVLNAAFDKEIARLDGRINAIPPPPVLPPLPVIPTKAEGTIGIQAVLTGRKVSWDLK